MKARRGRTTAARGRQARRRTAESLKSTIVSKFEQCLSARDVTQSFIPGIKRAIFSSEGRRCKLRRRSLKSRTLWRRRLIGEEGRRGAGARRARPGRSPGTGWRRRRRPSRLCLWLRLRWALLLSLAVYQEAGEGFEVAVAPLAGQHLAVGSYLFTVKGMH